VQHHHFDWLIYSGDISKCIVALLLYWLIANVLGYLALVWKRDDHKIYRDVVGFIVNAPPTRVLMSLSSSL
jgi:hypothetical protein